MQSRGTTVSWGNLNFDLGYRIARNIEPDGRESWCVVEMSEVVTIESHEEINDVTDRFPTLEELEAHVGFLKDTFDHMKQNIVFIREEWK